MPKKQNSKTIIIDPESTLANDLVQLMSRPDYRPMRFGKLAEELQLSGKRKDTLSSTIQSLIGTGKVVDLRHKGYTLSQSADLISGTISLLNSGAAFVKDPDSGREVFIRSNDTGTALSGDRVLVRIDRSLHRRTRDKGEQGVVVRLLERRRVTVVGKLKQMRRIYYVEPVNSSISQDLVVSDPAGANIGDRVLVKLIAWDTPHVSPEGEIVEVIGPADDPAFDTVAIIKANELKTVFPKAVIQQAEKARITETDFKERLDLRDKFVFTIDPETARDFDDAISMERSSNGSWRVGVHIADVSHFVPMNSALDTEARDRATSVYLPDMVIPMLPEQLSNGLCSLKPNVDRLAFSIIMTINEDGTLIKAKFAKTVICSELRLTYEQAMAAICTPPGKPCKESGLDVRTTRRIQSVSALSQKIREKRFNDGALSMNIPEMRFVLDESGRIANVEPVINDESHQLIEELMLLANEAVCRELCLRGVPLIHRIHEEPDEDKLAELAEVFEMFGIRTGNLSKRQNLTRVLRQIENMPQANAWNIKVLRSMKRAEYSEKRIAHYGLAKEYYCHFTSPIRRYPDLVVHRMLFAYLTHAKHPYTKSQLAEISRHCSQKESIASEAERDVVELKKIRFLNEQLTTGKMQDYQAVILEVGNYGLSIDVPNLLARGSVRVSDLDDDFYDFNPGRMELVGRRSGRVFAIGQSLTVNIHNVNEDRRFLDFIPVDLEPIESTNKPKRTKEKRETQKTTAAAGTKGRSRNSSNNRGGRRRNPKKR